MPVVLAIDDDPAILQFLKVVFADSDIDIQTASTASEGIQKAQEIDPEAILLDIDLPDMSGLEAFRCLQEHDRRLPTIFMTGRGTTGTAIEAMALGAFEYLTKPLQIDVLVAQVERAVEASRLMRKPPQLPTEKNLPGKDSDNLVGQSAGMQEVYKGIGRVAAQDVTVLILGESGTGKELVARAIYAHSKRRAAPFLAINCAAIPETLLESELFGHEKGSFTGAERRRIGKFEQCTGGTLFLDEIGDMTPLTQTKILRVLNEQRFERVGGNETVTTDVRVIAATNRDLESMVAANQFRGDLFYRLNVYCLKLPPLRERGEDLTRLVDHFVAQFNRELNKSIQHIAPEVKDMLREYSWPGNVRELQSVLKQSMLQASGPVLTAADLPPVLHGQHSASRFSAETVAMDTFLQQRLDASTRDLYAEWLAVTEPPLLRKVLSHSGGNLSQAARILGIDRSTLRTKLRHHGIDLES
ncbi:MAG: sigma-54-dependent transcriptional regulator [Gemmataceae bacterium]